MTALQPDTEVRGWLGLAGSSTPSAGWVVEASAPCPTVDHLVEVGELYLPPYFDVLLPLTGGTAAALQLAACSAQWIAHVATVGGGVGEWLTLTALDAGVSRSTGESDAGLRARVRRPEERVTLSALSSAIAAVLSRYTAADATVLEHFEHRVFADLEPPRPALILGVTRMLDAHHGITVVVPDGLSEEAYGQMVNAVNRVRGSGVRVWLLVEGTDG